jgi:hypothetical protein
MLEHEGRRCPRIDTVSLTNHFIRTAAQRIFSEIARCDGLAVRLPILTMGIKKEEEIVNQLEVGNAHDRSWKKSLA